MDSCGKLTEYLKKISPDTDIEAKAVRLISKPFSSITLFNSFLPWIFQQLASRYATQNAIRCSFSIDAECFTEEQSDFRAMGKKIFQPTTWGGIKLILMGVCPILRDFVPMAFIPRDVDKWFRSLVYALREERLKQPLQQEDLFQMLLNSVKKYDIDDVELVGYALTMFVEGYETSSSVLGFAIYEIARNPDIQDRLYEEISDVLAKYNGVCTFEALEEMEYLDNVIHETMRIDVVAPLIGKICTKEYTLPLIEGQKEPVTIYPGTPVQICVMAIHRFVSLSFEQKN